MDATFVLEIIKISAVTTIIIDLFLFCLVGALKYFIGHN